MPAYKALYIKCNALTLTIKQKDTVMLNNIQSDIKDTVSDAINEYLNYVDGYKINLVATHFKLTISNKYDYGATLDEILYFCIADLSNSIAVLNFINNDYK